MKIFKKTNSVVIAMVMVLSMFTFISNSNVRADNFSDLYEVSTDSWVYNFSTQTFTIKKNTKNYSSVDDIAWNYYLPDIKKLVVNKGVTEISPYSFFEAKNLEEIILSDSVKKIGREAFCGCTGLKTVDLSNCIVFDSRCFADCSNINNVTFSNSPGIVGDDAFVNCPMLTEVSLPGGISEIGSHAFGFLYNSSGYTPVKDFTISGKENTVAQQYAKNNNFYFVGNGNYEPVTEGTISTNLSWSYNTNTGELVISGEGAMLKYPGEYRVPWIELRRKITSVRVEEGVTSIGAYSFYNCTSLSKVHMSDSIRRIGDCSFMNCTSLAEVVAGTSVTSIGNQVFSGCTSLRKITLYDKIAEIGQKTFENCSDVTVYGYIGSYADTVALKNNFDFEFLDSPDETVAEIKTGTSGTCQWTYNPATFTLEFFTDSEYGDIQNYDFYESKPWNDFRKRICNIVFGKGIASVGDYAFKDCINLRSVILPDECINLGEFSFAGCSRLKSISLPNKSYCIGNRAFKDCKKLEFIDFGGEPASVGTMAFAGTKWLDNQKDGLIYINHSAYFYKGEAPENVTIKEGTTEISGGCFENSNVVNVTVPEGVTIIGGYAFQNCKKLKSISLPSTLMNLGSGGFDMAVFCGCSSLENIELPNNLYFINCNTFDGCTGLKKLVLPESIFSTSSYEFAECTSLETVVIGREMYSINSTAFEDCTALTNIILTPNTTEIKAGAFKNDNQISHIYFTGSKEEWSKIKIGENNGSFSSAVVHYNYKPKSGEENGVSWCFNAETGELTISGEGKIPYTPMYKYFWKDEIKSICLQGNVELQVKSFSEMPKLESVLLSENIKVIPDLTFYDCNNLREIRIPDSVTTISNSAFEECIMLKDVYYEGTKSQWNKKGFIIVHYSSDDFVIHCIDGDIIDTNETEIPENSKPTTPFKPNPVVNKTTLAISPKKKTLYVKGTTKIKATVKKGKGRTTYKSSNTKVAKVDSKGKVTAIKKGTAKITVANNGVKKTFTVTVKNPKLNATNKTLKAKKAFTIKITGRVGKATFTSGNKKIATVNSQGKVIAKKRGTTNITVKTNGITLKCKISVR